MSAWSPPRESAAASVSAMSRSVTPKRAKYPFIAPL
jgi:hypothetical protein